VFSFDPRCQGGMGVTGVDRDLGGDGELGVPGHLLALVPGDGPGQLGGQGGDGLFHGVLDLVGAPAVWEVQEQVVTGGPLHECAHRASECGPEDQVTSPVSGDGPVLDLGRSRRDHHHVGNLPPALDPALGATLGPTRAQAPGQLPTQLPPALDVEGLVDGLVAHVHHRIVREVRRAAQLARNLRQIHARGPKPPGHLLLLASQLAQWTACWSEQAAQRRARYRSPSRSSEAPLLVQTSWKASSPPTWRRGHTTSDPTRGLNRPPLVRTCPDHPVDRGLSPLVAKEHGGHGGHVARPIGVRCTSRT
jgi:hypothetical protein